MKPNHLQKYALNYLPMKDKICLNQDRLDVLIHVDDAQRLDDALHLVHGADVKEVRRQAAAHAEDRHGGGR